MSKKKRKKILISEKKLFKKFVSQKTNRNKRKEQNKLCEVKFPVENEMELELEQKR